MKIGRSHISDSMEVFTTPVFLDMQHTIGGSILFATFNDTTDIIDRVVTIFPQIKN